MKNLSLSILGLIIFNLNTIFDFQKNSDISNWNIVEDRVMGGNSNGTFFLNADGHAQFEGNVSLENNDGFVSVRYDMQKIDLENHQMISIKLKGHGKKYQFRIKNRDQNYYSYITEFSTNGEWQNIKIPLKEMYPYFRGRKLNLANFAHQHIDEIGILIGNKKNEKFQLLIDKIELE
ncbi:CIA30 family protein [Christiangramia forsetii]|uniref:NADH:ubiquinone oxidoreductase intermediate-associated protein 30 domain-containing protein n=2 Tax=Christiangramia forsetii TaxID=411153 RepID=A0M3S5_CHRFK|nr:CIA30 family protein [Christiangramia forsetii]GGG25093.1 CIA30 family protein [Christiangramia forsetii]CAL67270.1 conserved hypothetical protein [Christiangramia forsetii KT0803]